MDSTGSRRRWSFSRTEWLFVSATVVAWGLFAALLGKDEGWDFLNYHWYDAYAFLHGRLGFDVAVAHHATYFNPLIHVPFYLLATLGTSWLALFYLGALQGLNVIPLYWMSRTMLAPQTPAWRVYALPLIGMLGSTAVSMIRKTSYDQSLLSVLVLSALAIVIVGREQLEVRTHNALLLPGLAGALVGVSIGLKPAEAPYAAGIALALLMPTGSVRLRVTRLLACAVGGVLGVLLAGGAWFLILGHYSGSPLFPFFNSILRSPLVSGASFMDSHFVPHGFWDILGFPIRFALNYRVADDVPFRDLRIPLLYLLIPIACILRLARPRGRPVLVWPEVTMILFAFCIASYIVWIRELAIYRYIVALEMLAPLVLVQAVELIPVSDRARLGVVGSLLTVSAAFGHYAPGPFVARGDPYVQISQLSIPHPEHSMILMTGFEPMAYVIPSLPSSIPVLRIDGWLAGPEDGSGLTDEMRARVAAFSGDIYLLSAPYEREGAAKATWDYQLEIDQSKCQTLRTNLGGPYDFCRLEKMPQDLASLIP